MKILKIIQLYTMNQQDNNISYLSINMVWNIADFLTKCKQKDQEDNEVEKKNIILQDDLWRLIFN